MSDRPQEHGAETPDSPDWPELLASFVGRIDQDEPPVSNRRLRQHVRDALAAFTQTRDDYRWAYAKLEGYRRENHRFKALLREIRGDHNANLTNSMCERLEKEDLER